MPAARRAARLPRLPRARLGSRLLKGIPPVPQTVSGLRLWLAARRETAFTAGQSVATPTNWSGQGNVYTQATSTKQPTWETAVIDGQAVFRGAAAVASEWNATAGDILAATNNAAGLTLFIVGRRTGTTGVTEQFFDLRTNTTTSRFKYGYRFVSAQADRWHASGRRLDADAQVNSTSGVTVDTSWHLHTVVPIWSAGTVDFYREQTLDAGGVAWTTTGNTSATNSLNSSIFSQNGSEFLTGDIAELLVYDRVLSSTERQAVWDYLLGIYPSLAPSGTNAPAEAATGVGSAPDAAADIAANAEAATGTGSAPDPTAATGGNAEAASGVGSAPDPQAAVTATAEAATGSGTAPDPTPAVGANAEAATGVGAAPDPTVQAGNATNAAAEAAAGTGSAPDAGAAITAPAEAATGLGSAPGAGGAVAANAEAATGLGDANGAVGRAVTVDAGAASGTGAAPDATVSTAAITNAPAEVASGTGIAADPTAAVGGNDGGATAGTGTAPTAGPSVGALDSGASGTGAAPTPSTAVTVNAELASATGSAPQPIGQPSRDAPAAVASATGSALDAAIAIVAAAEAALGIGSAPDAEAFIPPPVPPPRYAEGAAGATGLAEGAASGAGLVEGVAVMAGAVEGGSSL